MKKTLQEQYNLIKEGKGHKDIFLKEAKTLFPDMVRNAATFDEASSILLQRSIISENTWGVVTSSPKTPDWFSIFNENIIEAKAVEKAPTKEVVDLETKGFNYKDKSNIDNIYGQAFLIGYYAELKNPKNTDKTVDDLKGIVAKNLEKNPLFYVENGQFGTKDLGYTKDFPGLGNTKEVKGKYASSGMEPATDEKAPKSNTKDLGKNEYKSDMPKDVEEMSIKPQSSRGVQKMDIPGKEKKIKLDEAYMGVKGEKYQISKSGSKRIPYYVLEKPDGSAQIDMMFDTEEDAKKYANKKELNLSEYKQSIKVGDIVQKSYASTDEDYIKEFEVISIDKNGKATLKDTKTGKLTGIHVNDLYKASMNESKSNPEIDKLLKIINTKKAGPEYKKALMDLIAMAEKKSGKTVNTKKEALLALDYVEPSINEANKENGIDGAKKQLDALGVKYEISKTDKVKPFKAIYKPINKSDDWYDKFENIVDLANLKGVVKTQTDKSLKENQLRSLIHNIIKEELNEGYGMSLKDAKAEAKRISAQERVVQHVEETEKGSKKYRVSDWYDSDLTVTSYNNGIES
jgi:hypothetical protein